jgi:hypothetical protein
VRSLLRQALLHAMKVAAWPEDPSRRHWRNEIRTFLADAREGFTPSMRQLLDLAVIHGDALRDLRDLEMDRPPLPLRETTDLTLDELLSRDLSTDALIARLRAD